MFFKSRSQNLKLYGKVVLFCLPVILCMQISCGGYKKEEISQSYKGGIVLQKRELYGDIIYVIKWKKLTFQVAVYDIDKNYKAGDTLGVTKHHIGKQK